MFNIRLKAEEQEQKTVIDYLWLKHKDKLFTTSPITKLSIFQGIKMKLLGYRAGTPDISILHDNGKYHGLFIEMKAKKGKLSEAQKSFLAQLNNSGYKAVVCYGADQAICEIDEYFKAVA